MRGYSAIGLINSKSDPNIGGALRAAHCYGAALVAVQGSRCRKESADTTKMARHIPLIHTSDIFQVVPDGCVPIAVEFVKEAIPLQNFTHPERALYIFGPEDGNVPVELILRCKHLIFVPTTYCMNLAATVNVVLYDRMAKREKRSKSVIDESHALEIVELETNKISHAS